MARRAWFVLAGSLLLVGIVALTIIAIRAIGAETEARAARAYLIEVVEAEVLRRLLADGIPIDSDHGPQNTQMQEEMHKRLGKFEGFDGSGYTMIGHVLGAPHLCGERTMRFAGGQVLGRIPLPFEMGPNDRVVRAAADVRGGRKSLRVHVNPFDLVNPHAVEITVLFDDRRPGH